MGNADKKRICERRRKEESQESPGDMERSKMKMPYLKIKYYHVVECR